MTPIVAFTVVSKDDFWQEKADQLKHHLSKHGIDLVICSLDDPPVNSRDDRPRYYYLKDINFVDFAKQDRRRRIWLIDAEVRLVRPLPSTWLESPKSVIFYHDVHTNSNEDRIINTGHCIFDRSFIKFYAQAIEMAKAAAPTEGSYDIERHIHKIPLPDHIKEIICMDRIRAVPGCRSTASRGLFVLDKTILTHPYHHNFRNRTKNAYYSLVPAIDKEAFYDHFSPLSLATACKVADLLLACNDDLDAWNQLGIDGFDNGELVKSFNKIMPESLNQNGSLSRPYKCYTLLDWIFCPKLQLFAPRDEWPQRSYKLIDSTAQSR